MNTTRGCSLLGPAALQREVIYATQDTDRGDHADVQAVRTDDGDDRHGGFEKNSAERILADGAADLVSFGKSFIANPDLPARFRQGAPLNRPNPETFYAGGEQGYTDDPTLGSSSE